MRTNTIITAAALAAALTTTVATGASAQSYYPGRAPTGGGLGSVVSCDAPGGRQGAGALIGALVGGVVGNNIAKNERTAGTVVGAGLGAAAGSYVGCKQQRDRAASYGYAQPAYGYAQPAADGRGGFVARSTVNIRANPNTRAPVVGKIYAGQAFEVTSQRGAWVGVGQNGRTIGYVAGAYVDPIG